MRTKFHRCGHNTLSKQMIKSMPFPRSHVDWSYTMATTKCKCWLTFEGGHQNEPCLWKMAKKYPDVMFDIRQAQVTKDIGIMAVLFEGEEDQVQEALEYLQELGVKVDPVEGGSLVAG